MKESDCPCSNPNKKMVNHAVSIIGYGKSSLFNGDRLDCDEYWIIHNSWGPNWGEKGNFRLCMDKSDDTPLGIC